MKILIVDDDADILRMIVKLLTHHGHQVSQCATPFGVSALVVREQPDVVVLDMMMPGLSGAALTEIINKLETPPQILLWSAMADHQLAEEGARLGVPYVSKSERPSVLVEAIAKLQRA
jgi:DNA-binding response OmpR family regulator